MRYEFFIYSISFFFYTGLLHSLLRIIITLYDTTNYLSKTRRQLFCKSSTIAYIYYKLCTLLSTENFFNIFMKFVDSISLQKIYLKRVVKVFPPNPFQTKLGLANTLFSERIISGFNESYGRLSRVSYIQSFRMGWEREI